MRRFWGRAGNPVPRGLLFAAALVQAGETPLSAQPAPSGQEITLPVVRDTWFSGVGSEADANLGGAARLKLKSIQEMSLIDIDPKPLRGKTIRSATLHLRSTGEPALKRVTVGSFGAPWVEGTSGSYAPQKGSSTFNHRAHPDVPWTVPGSDLCSVILAQGGTTWRMADATPPDAHGWQHIAVDPAIVAARIAGVSEGFFLYDDTGSEWTRRGETFEHRLFPNRFVYSRDSNRASAPYLTVTLGPEDHAPPAPPRDVRSESADLPAGEAKVSWAMPRDAGPAGVIGFLVDVNGKPAPRYLIPIPRLTDERMNMFIRDLGLKPGSEAMLSVRAVDGAGNVSQAAETRVRVSARLAAGLPGVVPPFLAADAADAPRLGNARVSVVDELDKVHPLSAEMIPKQAAGYLHANHLWSAQALRVRLHAAKNEFVGFQVVVDGDLKGIRPSLTFTGDGVVKVKAAFGRYQPVQSAKGPLPDPIVPLETGQDASVAGQTSGSLHVEVYVPHTTPAGDHKGTLTLKRGQDVLALEVALRVWDFTLPDSLSFLPDMNCYGLPENERDYYRLAHAHRTVLNRVPYSQNGIVADGWAPKWDGRRLDWKAWDRRFGPYFDGSAFADLPRKGVPIECFYLPMHENWPTPMEGITTAIPGPIAPSRRTIAATSWRSHGRWPSTCMPEGGKTPCSRASSTTRSTSSLGAGRAGRLPGCSTSRRISRIFGPSAISGPRFTKASRKRPARPSWSSAATSLARNGSATRSTACSTTTSSATRCVPTTGS